MDGKLIGLVRDTLVRQYGEGLWGALANRDAASAEAPSDSLACWLGQHAVPALADTYPSLFSRHDDLASFIGGLGDDLPVAGARVEDDEVPLAFQTTTGPDGQIFLRIEAHCSICAVVQGVIAGAAVHYGELVAIHQIKSRRRGDNVCLLQIEVGDSADVPEVDSLDGFLAVGNA
ncbi:MAG: hypothetical protein R3195_15310 [Gemmatimonadota bacterium]|nr:hypothetical protein [Gemmatimonadota bacterium]